MWVKIDLHALVIVLCFYGELLASKLSLWPYSTTATPIKPNVTCPPSRPFQLTNGSHTVCVAQCGPKLVLEGSKCINVTQCTRAVLSEGRCMDRCPEGSLYIDFDEDPNDWCGHDGHGTCSYTEKDIKNAPCVKKVDIILRVVVFLALTVMYILLTWAFFSTRKFSLSGLLSIIMNTVGKKKRAADVEVLINADEDAEN